MATDHPMLLHGALFVRGACRLDHADTFPGPLLFDLPDLSNLVDATERPEVSEAWDRWWASLVAVRRDTVGDALPPPGDARPPTGPFRSSRLRLPGHGNGVAVGRTRGLPGGVERL